ncbi:MAG: purine-nucleoside phosphorylase [Ruminococcaceae bacterium]|nr:purine-nucleoside phosphorylase [Oscillospiraceae bacterium]
MNYPTPHINATPADFAKTVLMPGDPLRAKFIAENFLENAKLVNNVRGVQGYTGLYKGTRVSVMASGMGMPSIGIYSHELYNFFGVENIIRVGSAGALRADIKVRDIVIGMGACTNSSFPKQFGMPGAFTPIADFTLLEETVNVAREHSLSFHVGNLLSSDTFYNEDADSSLIWAKMGVMAVEMEAAALYSTAARSGKRALAVCTISDSLVSGEALDSDARQNSFTDMMKLALDVAVKMESKSLS